MMAVGHVLGRGMDSAMMDPRLLGAAVFIAMALKQAYEVIEAESFSIWLLAMGLAAGGAWW